MNCLMTDELNEKPTELEQTVGLLSKTARMQEVGAAHALSVRMPILVFATLKAMAEHSGQSINKIAVQILRVGIDSVSDALPDADANTIDKIRSRVLADLIAAAKFDQVED